MVLPFRKVAALLAAGALLAPPSAASAAPPMLLAQAPTEQFPPLEDGMPEGPEGPTGPTGATGPTGSDGRDKKRDPKDPLPDTGAETWLIALLGTGMILSGSGLKLTLQTGHGRRG